MSSQFVHVETKSDYHRGQSYDCIDLAKFIGSVLIFSMHCNALGDIEFGSFVLEIAARWGVPFFFISSSYFLLRKGENGNITETQLKNYILRIGRLYLIWFFYNLPNIFAVRLYSKDLTSVRVWLHFVKNSMLSSTFTASWFLGSSLFSAWFVYTLGKKMSTKALLGISFVLYLPCIFSSVYYGLTPHRIIDVLSFICFPLNIFNGCIYFAVGKYICENEKRIKERFRKRRCVIFFLLFYSLYVVELLVSQYYSWMSSTDVSFFILPAAFFLFLFCLQTETKIHNALLFRKLSTIIYLCQGNIIIGKVVIGRILGIESMGIQYIFALIMATIVIAVVLYLQKKDRWRWVKYLT